MKLYQIEQLVTEAADKIRKGLQAHDREQECLGAIVRIVVSSEYDRAAVEVKILTGHGERDDREGIQIVAAGRPD